MNNKKTIIAIIVTIAVVIIGLGGYFGYGYYCKVNQTKQLNAKIEEFEKLSFDTDKDKKVNIYKELENDAKSYNKVEDAYNALMETINNGSSDEEVQQARRNYQNAEKSKQEIDNNIDDFYDRQDDGFGGQ